MSTVHVVGGGPAGLIAAERLAQAGVTVTVHDRMPSVARKLLMAGHGGLNITHSEPLDRFRTRYGPSADRLDPMLATFGPDALRRWCADLGEPTFVGSSGRVFPASFRAVPLVRAWLARLAGLGVQVRTRERWTGWTQDGELSFVDAGGAVTHVRPDATVLALGGASWPRLGSDGGWVSLLGERGVQVRALRPANVGVRVAWSPVFAERFAGVPLKHVALTVPGRTGTSTGDAMVTAAGLEGGPVYAVGVPIREALDADGRCVLHVDLRPDLTVEELQQRLSRRRAKDSAPSWLRRSIGLDAVSTALLWEAGGGLPTDPAVTAALVKAVPVVVTGTMPIDRAISTAGGVAWSEVDEQLMLHRLPGTFVAGEMLDWEAPTGGYLLQGCFSTGVVAAGGVLRWLAGAGSSGIA
ncbi:TIGR03862 family flavoprotein [Cellulomonas sp. 73-145]|uniref:TIGR03862 family flavoprotein n=1 Tax=Cellulomonas sp. 73-145 TaxID=1895739 RepID=UPI000A4894FE|nr:TIGR03862 family flavoprotein [Cellulomonas sp. 73-145]